MGTTSLDNTGVESRLKAVENRLSAPLSVRDESAISEAKKTRTYLKMMVRLLNIVTGRNVTKDSVR